MNYSSSTTTAAAAKSQTQPSPSVHSDSFGDSSFAAILSIFLLILIPILIYAIIYSIRCPNNPLRRSSRSSDDGPAKDQKSKKAHVELVSTVKYNKRDSPENETGTECSVCLSAFTDGEEISELNECKHTFHAKCINTWLRSQSTCPICRTTLPVKRSRRPPAVGAADDFRQGLPDAGSLV